MLEEENIMAKLSSLPVGSKVKITHSTIGDIPCIVAAQNHDGYPSNSTTLITEKIILLRCFDAKEPNNSDANRKSYGNNKYSVSNLDQWLNSSAAAGQWYSARHSADQAPNNANVWNNYNAYDQDAGFLAGFDAAFVAALKDTTLKVALTTATDGGSYESVVRKFFLPSKAELFGVAENSIMEGSLLSYFSANTDAVRIAQISAYAAAHSEYSVTAGSNWYYWLRTPHSSYSYSVRYVGPDGCLYYVSVRDGSRGVRPLCNLDSGISVSDSTDSDGCYTLMFGDKNTINLTTPNGIKLKTTGKYCADDITVVPTLQEKSVTPSTTAQEITPDTGNCGLSKVSVSAVQTEVADVTPSKGTQTVNPTTGKYFSQVVVEPIPDDYIIPSGTQNITENGTYDVTSKATAVVDVPVVTEVATTAEMNALLVAANVGKYYKFTGTTDGTYTNGDIYLVEEGRDGDKKEAY